MTTVNFRKVEFIMKRIFNIFFSITIMLSILASFPINAQSQDDMSGVKNILYFTSGYGNIAPQKNIVKIISAAELADYYNNNIQPFSQGVGYHVENDVFLNSQYNEVFFENSFLVFIELEIESGSTQIQISSVLEKNEIIEVEIKRVLAELSTPDEVYWNIVLEMDKSLSDKDLSLSILSTDSENVPQTGIPNISGYTMVMFIFFIVSMGLWLYIFIMRHRKGNA